MLFTEWIMRSPYLILKSALLLTGSLCFFFFSFGCSLSVAGTLPTITYPIDASRVSENQEARVRLLVLHYTERDLATSLKLLTEKAFKVSAHYLVPNPEEPGRAYGQLFSYRLVPEHRLAHHAGISHWQGEQSLNAGSIGIEIVNLGFEQSKAQRHNPKGVPMPPEGPALTKRTWIHYPEGQVKVIAALVRNIIDRHHIQPDKIVGHSDIAPQRKIDPGPLFPWAQLYQEFGIGAWPDENRVRWYMDHAPWKGDLAELRRKLDAYGYEVSHSEVAPTSELNWQTRNIISAFQMHFRQKKMINGAPGYDGIPDVETVARLDALLEKYRSNR
jgi:N-acetyl-anhydromuramyl-L-alanine amidase AmpD